MKTKVFVEWLVCTLIVLDFYCFWTLGHGWERLSWMCRFYPVNWNISWSRQHLRKYWEIFWQKYFVTSYTIRAVDNVLLFNRQPWPWQICLILFEMLLYNFPKFLHKTNKAWTNWIICKLNRNTKITAQHFWKYFRTKGCFSRPGLHWIHPGLS